MNESSKRHSKLLSLTFTLNCLFGNVVNETSAIVSLSHLSAVTKQTNEITRNQVAGKNFEELRILKSFQDALNCFKQRKSKGGVFAKARKGILHIISHRRKVLDSMPLFSC